MLEQPLRDPQFDFLGRTDQAPQVAGSDLPKRPKLFGLIRLGGLCVAIPAFAIREVVPCPVALDPFPATRPDVVGAIDLRGQLIPVLDLTSAIAASHADLRPSAIVVILRHGGKVFGALAEGIDGVSLIEDSTIGDLAITAAGPSKRPLVRSTFHHGDRRGMLLDLDAVGSLPGLPRTDDLVGQRNRARASEEPTLIFTLGKLRCALPTSCVDATLPWQDLPGAPVGDDLWIAMLPYKGAEIPVIDTLALLGHGRMEPGRRRGAAIVLRTELPTDAKAQAGGPGYGLAALLIDSVDDIVRFGADAITPLPEGTPGAQFARGLIQRRQVSCLLLDPARLVDDPRLCRLGTIEQRSEQGAGSVAASFTRTTGLPSTPVATKEPRKPYLVFAIGEGVFSVLLHSVDEILPATYDLVPIPDSGCGIIGLLSRRGLALPVIDLGRSLGINAGNPPDHGFVVVARFTRGSETLRAGFRVDALNSVERAVAQHIDPNCSAATDREAVFGMMACTIRLENGHACCVIDLADVAQRIIQHFNNAE